MTTQEEDRLSVLDRLHSGEISTEEAEAELATLGTDTVQSPSLDLPDTDRLWIVPLGIGLGIFGVFGSMLRRSNVFGALFLLPLTLLGLGISAIGIMSRSSHWVHVRVQSKDGTNVRISLPFPLEFAGWIMAWLEPYIKHHAQDANLDQLDITALIREMGDELSPENPLIVNVDDDDDKVFVYIT